MSFNHLTVSIISSQLQLFAWARILWGSAKPYVMVMVMGTPRRDRPIGASESGNFSAATSLALETSATSDVRQWNRWYKRKSVTS